MPGRIKYNSINVDLERAWTSYDIPKIQKRGEIKAGSGVAEYLTGYAQQKIFATRNKLSPQEIYELEQFYEYAKDGSTFSFYREKDLVLYIPFEGKSLTTNDGGAGTFTRTNVNDSAFYLDPSTGLLTAINSADTARFPAGKYGRGVLIEGSRQNLLSYCSAFSNAAWAKTNITVTTSDTTEVADPAGGNIADKLTATAANGTFYFDTSTTISTNDGVGAIWLKTPSGNSTGQIILKDDTGATLNGELISVTPTWTRFVSAYDNPGSNANNWRLELEIDTNTDVWYAYGATLEVGSGILFPSQTIAPSATSATTRNAEKLLYTTPSEMNPLKGTISFWFYPEWDGGSHNTAILFKCGASNTVYHSAIVADGTDIRIQMKLANTSTFAFNASVAESGNITQNAWHHVVFTYDATQGEEKLYLDNSLVIDSSNDAFTPTDIGNIYVGSNVDGSNVAFCVFDDLAIWSKVLDAAAVRRIYNLGHGLGFRKNYFSSVRLTNPDFNPVHKVGDRYSLSLRMEEVLT